MKKRHLMVISTKKYHTWDWVSKHNSKLSFLLPFSSGKKCLEFFRQDVYMKIKYSVSLQDIASMSFNKNLSNTEAKKKALLIKKGCTF